MKKKLLLVVVTGLAIGSCILAAAGEPNADNSAQPIVVTGNVTVEAATPGANSNTPPVIVTTVQPAKPATNNNRPWYFATAVEAPKPGANKTSDNPFAGKIVRVQMTGATRNEVFILENVKLTTLNGGSEAFLAGTGIKDGSDRTSLYEGLEVHLNLRLVASCIAMTPKQWKDKQRSAPRFGPGRSEPTQPQAGPPQGIIPPMARPPQAIRYPAMPSQPEAGPPLIPPPDAVPYPIIPSQPGELPPLVPPTQAVPDLVPSPPQVIRNPVAVPGQPIPEAPRPGKPQPPRPQPAIPSLVPLTPPVASNPALPTQPQEYLDLIPSLLPPTDSTPPPASVIAPSIDGAQVKAAQGERVKLLTHVVEILASQYKVGTVDFPQLSAAESDLCNALLDATDEPEKRIALLTKQLDKANEFVALMKGRFDAGAVSEVDLDRAKLLCLDVKIKLLREGNGKKATTPDPRVKRP